ncbi:hypothetical protein [Sphingopyxis fribergensis]
MKKRAAVITIMLLGLTLGGCADANIYDMPPDQVYTKLIALEQGTPSAIDVAGVRRDIYGTPGKSVTWVTDYAHAYYECTAYLTPEGPARTSVNVGCSDENAPAKFAIGKAIVGQIAGKANTQLPVGRSFNGARNRHIELIDSTLDERPFDKIRGKSQVMGWPDPPA